MLLYQTVCSRNGDSCAAFRNIGKPVGLQLGKIRMYSTWDRKGLANVTPVWSLEPPYTEPYVRWCGRTEEATPPTQFFKNQNLRKPQYVGFEAVFKNQEYHLQAALFCDEKLQSIRARSPQFIIFYLYKIFRLFYDVDSLKQISWKGAIFLQQEN